MKFRPEPCICFLSIHAIFDYTASGNDIVIDIEHVASHITDAVRSFPLPCKRSRTKDESRHDVAGVETRNIRLASVSSAWNTYDDRSLDNC